jgi:GTP pyrophosphokinase
VLGQAEGNIVALGLKERDRAFHAYQADVEVDDLKHLTDILTGLKAPRAVVSAERVTA